MAVRRYQSSDAAAWDALVSVSRNGTFLHRRPYMDYHSDRFADASLMGFDGHGRVVALLPACRKGDEVVSHAGLTYGGWIVPEAHFSAIDMMELWERAIELWRAEGVKRLVYRPVPWIYQRQPADDDVYGLVRMGGRIEELRFLQAVDVTAPLPFNENARRAVAKARKAGVVVGSDSLEAFWPVLEATLAERFGARPVHTINEMRLLQGRFPENIRVVTARVDGEVVAGTVLYLTGRVARTQYIAASERGRQLGALPLVMQGLIKEYGEAGYKYFDFGTSADDDSANGLNDGLVMQKTGMGGRPVSCWELSFDIDC